MTPVVTVLVADDEPDLRLLIRIRLEEAGFAVVEEAVDGDAALAAVARLAPPPIPAVIVLDNQMPGLSGLDVAERILAEVPDQRIVLFSAFLDSDVCRRAEELGIRVCLAKVDIAQLPAIVRELASS